MSHSDETIKILPTKLEDQNFIMLHFFPEKPVKATHSQRATNN